jgi:microcystin-dependent protein
MEPYIGEIKMFPFGIVPKGWAACNGQLLPIQQNQPLFSLLGTQFGGNGINNFALPNLQGRIPVHCPAGTNPGTIGGSNTTTLNATHLPVHGHNLKIVSSTATVGTALGGLICDAGEKLFTPKAANALVAMAATSIAPNAPVPVSNMQPHTGLSICISLAGIYPSRS